MRPPFEIWAAQEIAKLRTEADALQRTLNRYMGLADAPVRSSVTAVTSATSSPSASLRKPVRASKYGPILDWLDQAGPSGMTMNEIVGRLEAMGSTVKRGSLRAFLWNQGADGRVVNRNGRYLAQQHQNAGEPEVSPSSSPDLLEGAMQ